MFLLNWLFSEYRCLPPQNCKVTFFFKFLFRDRKQSLGRARGNRGTCEHAFTAALHDDTSMEQIFSSHSFEINHHQLQALRKLPCADTVRFSTTYGLAVEQGSPSSKQSFQRGKLISCHLFFIHKWIQDHSSYFCWKWKFRLLPVLSAV